MIREIALAAGAAISLLPSASASSKSREADEISSNAPGAVLLLGEIHGTNEVPAYTSSLIRTLTRQSHLVVGLELNDDSAGLPCESGKLRARGKPVPASWSYALADGRSSVAMAKLVCQAKELERKGLLSLVYLEGPGRDRDFDSKAAGYLDRVLKRYPNARALVLTGNFHALNNRPSMAWALRNLGYAVTTTTVSSGDRKAAAWQCQRDGCGLKSLDAALCPEHPGNSKSAWYPSQDPRWDKCVSFPHMTASFPYDAPPPAK